MHIQDYKFLAEDGGGAARDIRPYVMKLLLSHPGAVGVDVGCSQHKILASAIGVDTRRGDHAQETVANPMTAGREAVNLVGDGLNLHWFRDDCLDYVFSSHMLEHQPQEMVRPALTEWCRVLKPEGVCVIYLPDARVRQFPEYHEWHPVPEDILQHTGMFRWAVTWVPREHLSAHECTRSLAWSFLIVLQK